MWKKLENSKPELNKKVKVKRQISKGNIEYESTGILTSRGFIVEKVKGVKISVPTHWDYLK